MEILIQKISENHNETFHYNGVVAYGKAKSGKTFVLQTQPQAEIMLNERVYVGDQITGLSQTLLLNDDFDDNDILVDSYLVIAEARGTDIEDIIHQEDPDEKLITYDYDSGIIGFTYFLRHN